MEKFVQTLKDLKRVTDVPVLIIQHQGLIIYVNGCFGVVFGWSFDQIVGQSLATIIPKSFHDAHNLGFSRFAITEKSTVLNHPLQLKAVTKDGREIDMEHFIIAEQQQGQWMFGATLRPLAPISFMGLSSELAQERSPLS